MLYDYKSDELVQEVYISCLYPIIEDIADEYSTLRRYDNLSIYAPSYIVREILSRLLDETDDLWVHTDSDISLIYADGNDLIVTIGYDGMIFIESAKNDGVIKSNEDCCLTYFYDGLGRKDLSALEENAESILVFGFECEDDICDCDEECECEDKTDEKSELSTTSASEYYVNNKPVSKEEFDREFSMFKDIYMDNINNVMSDYFELMDRITNSHRLVRF